MPVAYSKELGELICDRLAHGESLSAVCRDMAPDGPDNAMVTRWLLRSEKGDPGFEGFAELYRFARDVGVDVLFDELWDIANDDSNDTSFTDQGRVGHQHRQAAA
jgi:hypothetical protein